MQEYVIFAAWVIGLCYVGAMVWRRMQVMSRRYGGRK